MQKKLMICENIGVIERATKRKPASMTIVFKYPSYLECNVKEADKLLQSLIEQITGGIFAKPKIIGLRLVWDEEDKNETEKD